jgi:hypothetical protein
MDIYVHYGLIRYIKEETMWQIIALQQKTIMAKMVTKESIEVKGRNVLR